MEASMMNCRLPVYVAVFLGLAFLLTGCTRDATPDNVKQSADSKTLNVLNWSDYIDEKLIAEFETRHGVKVIYDKISADDELEAKLLVSKANYDVVFPSDRSMPVLVKKNVLAELDRAK